jgi:uncharacterized membrane protein
MKYLPFVFALGTALFWGLYGPTLGKARLAGDVPNPFKPYVGIGIAYLIIAIAGGLAAMVLRGDKMSFNDGVFYWGFGAGILGALGAFSLTLAMTYGGAKIPHAVMPFVFGGAVTVTALYGIVVMGARGNIWMWIGIIGMGVSAILVAANTPHGPPKAHEEQGESQAAAADSAATPAHAAAPAEHSG